MASSLYVVKRGKECGLLLSTRYSRVLVSTEMEVNASFSQLKLGQVPSRLYFPRHFFAASICACGHEPNHRKRSILQPHYGENLIPTAIFVASPGARHNLVTHPRAEVIECKLGFLQQAQTGKYVVRAEDLPCNGQPSAQNLKNILLKRAATTDQWQVPTKGTITYAEAL